jgi:two-component system LytT family response regulator
MKIKLKCPESHYLVIMELLKTRGIEVSEESSYCLVDKCIDSLPNDNQVIILFDSQNPKQLLNFMDELSPDKEKTDIQTIIGKKGESYVPLQVEDIYYFEAAGNIVYCKTKTDRYEVTKKLYELEKKFGDLGFIRINKSHIINILMVSEIFQWFNGKLLLRIKDQKQELEVSRFYVKIFKDFLGL